MIRIKLLSSTAAALLIGFAGSAMANVDVNDLCLGAEAGGEVSAASLDAGFRSIDTNGDGYLSVEEYDVCLTSTAAAQAGSKNTKERMAAFDTDGDNQISREEYAAAGGSLTGGADSDDSAAGEGAGASSQSVAAGTMSEPGDEDQAGAAGADAAQGGTESGQSGESGDLSSDSGSSAVGTTATTSEPGDEDQAGTADAATAEAQTAEGTQGADEMTAQSESSVSESSVGDSSVSESDSAVAAAPATPGDAELQQLASEVIGKNLVNSNGEDLGEIEDVVIDDGGDAVYLIAAVGGFLGLGERDIAVPFQGVGMQDDAVVLMEPMTKEELEQMPPYEDGTYRSLKAE